MSPVTGLVRLPGRILWCVHMGNFSPVDRVELKKHKETVSALWTLVTLRSKLSFVPVTGLEYSYGQIFIPVTEIAVTKTEA